MNEQYPTAICVALNYLADRGWQSRLSGFNPDAIDEEKGDVWQTPATTKKKQE